MLLAIDPGTLKAGFAMLKKASRRDVTLEACWVVRFRKTQEKHDRLTLLREAVEKAIEDFNPEAYAIEAGYSGPNRKTALVIAEARGVVLGCFPIGAKVIEVQPSEAKQMATGRGNADKNLVRRMIAAQFGIRGLPDEDAADACAVGLAAAARMDQWIHVETRKIPGITEGDR